MSRPPHGDRLTHGVLVTGQRIFRYRIVEKVGEGGTGGIYWAEDGPYER